MPYEQVIETGRFDLVQQALRNFSDVPFGYGTSWTGSPTWSGLLKLIQDNPFAKDKFKYSNWDCGPYATQFRNWAQTQVPGLCLGVCQGSIPVNKKMMGHTWNWAYQDNQLLFIDFYGTGELAYQVPHTVYWVMKAMPLKGIRIVTGWNM